MRILNEVEPVGDRTSVSLTIMLYDASTKIHLGCLSKAEVKLLVQDLERFITVLKEQGNED